VRASCASICPSRSTEAHDEEDEAIYTVAAETGARMSEIRALKVSDVDFAVEVIRLEDGYTTHGGFAGNKGRRTRSVPMSANVRRVLWPFCHGKDGEELVFQRRSRPGESRSSMPISRDASSALASGLVCRGSASTSCGIPSGRRRSASSRSTRCSGRSGTDTSRRPKNICTTHPTARRRRADRALGRPRRSGAQHAAAARRVTGERRAAAAIDGHRVRLARPSASLRTAGRTGQQRTGRELQPASVARARRRPGVRRHRAGATPATDTES
jgi:integrase